MKIELNNISKRYRREWIFKKINYQFQSGEAYAILGRNGSGKSTLLKIISGHLTPTKGKVHYSLKDTKVELDNFYTKLSYTGPYIELINEFTLSESITFHQKFKPFLKGIGKKEILDILKFSKIKNKEIRHFSSGMKQRLKLILAICSETPVLMLDEPSTNLDREGIEWYKELVGKFRKNRTTIIASNVEEDYFFCKEVLNIVDYK